MARHAQRARHVGVHVQLLGAFPFQGGRLQVKALRGVQHVPAAFQRGWQPGRAQQFLRHILRVADQRIHHGHRADAGRFRLTPHLHAVNDVTARQHAHGCRISRHLEIHRLVQAAAFLPRQAAVLPVHALHLGAHFFLQLIFQLIPPGPAFPGGAPQRQQHRPRHVRPGAQGAVRLRHHIPGGGHPQPRRPDDPGQFPPQRAALVREHQRDGTAGTHVFRQPAERPDHPFPEPFSRSFHRQRAAGIPDPAPEFLRRVPPHPRDEEFINFLIIHGIPVGRIRDAEIIFLLPLFRGAVEHLRRNPLRQRTGAHSPLHHISQIRASPAAVIVLRVQRLVVKNILNNTTTTRRRCLIPNA